eukprot:740078-Karenia_brevis.AAC.1
MYSMCILPPNGYVGSMTRALARMARWQWRVTKQNNILTTCIHKHDYDDDNDDDDEDDDGVVMMIILIMIIDA